MPDTGAGGFAGLTADNTDALLERAGSQIATGRQLPAADLQPLHDGIGRADKNDVRMALAQAIIVLVRGDELAAEARRLLHDERGEVREAAYDGLVERGFDALPALEVLADDDDREPRWFVYQAAARIESTDVIPLLVRGLHDDDFSIRWTSSNALIEHGPITIQPLLEALATEHATRPFHEAARRVLSRLDAGPPLDLEVARLVDALGRNTSGVEAPQLAREMVQQLYPRP